MPLGAIAMGEIVAGLFFCISGGARAIDFSCWAAFRTEGLSRTYRYNGSSCRRYPPGAYLVRLLAYGLILIWIKKSASVMHTEAMSFVPRALLREPL